MEGGREGGVEGSQGIIKAAAVMGTDDRGRRGSAERGLNGRVFVCW